MIIGYYDEISAKATFFDMLKYDAIQEDGIIYKDVGLYVQMLVPMQNVKGHDTYEVF